MLDDKRIRTLTAREGYRFMGVRDVDIDRILANTNLSDRSHISLAGNSICVPVMQAIFNKFLTEYKNDGSSTETLTAMISEYSETVTIQSTNNISQEVESDDDFWKI
jgi:alanine-alpha-ketoisovalerate/valine-pyruvate aminotransferase